MWQQVVFVVYFFVNYLFWSVVSKVYRPTRHIVGHFGDDFFRLNSPTNSAKVLKHKVVWKDRSRENWFWKG